MTLQAGENYNLTQVTITKSCPDDVRPGLRLLGVQRDGHGHGRAPAPRRRHRPGLLRVDEQRERPLEQRELPRQRHVGPEQPQQDLEQPGVGLPQVRPLLEREELLELHQLRQPALPRRRRRQPALGQRRDRQVQRHRSRPWASRRWSTTSGPTTGELGHGAPSPPSPMARSTPTTVPPATSISARRTAPAVFAATLSDAPGRHHQEHGVRVAGIQVDPGQRLQGLHPGTPLLGQDLLHLAPRPDQRLAAELTSARTTTPSSGTRQRQLANQPSGNYTINYKAILAWIKNTGPNPFPSQLRSGNILYYDQIPTDVPASAYTHTNLNSAITDANQRFWKEYIDYVVGVWRDPCGTVQHPGQPGVSYGPDYTFGTIKISAPPDRHGAAYMNYADNPERPRHRLWFGPMTMVQFMSDTGHPSRHGPRHLDVPDEDRHRRGTPGHPEQPPQRPGVDDPVQPPALHRRSQRHRRVQPGPVQPDQQHAADDQLPLDSPQQRHQRRPPLGRQRCADAPGLRRLDREHGVQLRLHAGVQPAELQQHPEVPRRVHRAGSGRKWASRAPSG